MAKKGTGGVFQTPLGSSGQTGGPHDVLNTQGTPHEAVPLSETPADPQGWLSKTIGGKKK